MRIILSNRDADRLHQALDSGSLPSVDFSPPDKCIVRVGDERFTGKARPTPNEAGVLRVEDMDGRIVMEADQ
jgi:hypothetical protein